MGIDRANLFIQAQSLFGVGSMCGDIVQNANPTLTQEDIELAIDDTNIAIDYKEKGFVLWRNKVIDFQKSLREAFKEGKIKE